MKQTFFTAYGKAVIENHTLFIQNTKSVPSSKWVLEILLPFLFIIQFVTLLVEDPSPKRNARLVLVGFVVFFNLFVICPAVYKILFRRSFARRIPLQKIVGFRTKDDPNELEVHVYLQLQSGKERKITFRKLEKQYEALTGSLSQHLPLLKFA